MPLNVIVVMDPIAHIKIAKDTTLSLIHISEPTS